MLVVARPLATPVLWTRPRAGPRHESVASASLCKHGLQRWPPTTRAQFACDVAEDPDDIPELDVAAMIADMRPPSDDDVPIALDGTRLDTPAKLIACLNEINAGRQAAAQRA